MMDGRLIAYRCVAEHYGEASIEKVTVHERKWAYCPFDVRAGGHRWIETGGVTLFEVELEAHATA